MVECEEALIDERMKKLDGEERIPGCLLLHQPGQWRRLRCIAAKRISNQLPKLLAAQGASVISSTFPPWFLIVSSLRMSGCAASTSLSR